MKKLLFLLVPFMLLVACRPDYHNKIKNTLRSSVYKQGCITCFVSGATRTELSTDSLTLDSIRKGYVDTTRISTQYTGAAVTGMFNFTHKMLRISKTGYQDWTDFWHTGWRIIGTILALILVVGGLYKYITINNNNKNAKTRQEGTSTLLWMILVAAGCFLLGGTIYPWSDEGYISAAQYDANQAKDGDQRAYDWNNVQGL